jgi:hypothetical protein
MLSDIFTQQARAHFQGDGQDPVVVAALGQRIDALASAPELAARLTAWVELIGWLRSAPGATERDADGLLHGPALARWRMLFDFLDASPAAQCRRRSAAGCSPCSPRRSRPRSRVWAHRCSSPGCCPG